MEQSLSLLTVRALDWFLRLSGSVGLQNMQTPRHFTYMLICTPVILTIAFMVYQWWR